MQIFIKLCIYIIEHKGKFMQKDHRHTAALNTQVGSKQRSNKPNVTEKSCHNAPRNISHPPNQATTLSGSCATSNSAWPLCLKGNESEVPAKQNTAQRQKAQDVREYMHRQVLERRRRERCMRRKVEFEQERKRRSVQDIVKKQQEALLRTRKQQTQESGVCIVLCVKLVAGTL